MRTDTVLAHVFGKTEREIRIDGIHTLILQLVGANLVNQADTPAFLTHV